MKSGFDRIGHTVSVEHAQRSCLDKRHFDSKTQARDVARKREKSGAPRLYVYRCTLCGGFHLTSKVPAGLQRRNGKAPSETGRLRKEA